MRKITPERLEEIAKWIFEQDPQRIGMIEDLQTLAKQMRQPDYPRFVPS